MFSSLRFLAVSHIALAGLCAAGLVGGPSSERSGGPRACVLLAHGDAQIAVDDTDLEPHPTTLRTRSIARGSTTLSAPSRLVRAAQGSALVQRGSVLEELHATGDSVEQTFTFDRRPDGEGDLVIDIDTDGSLLASDAERGLRFQGAGGAVRYGAATWIDARGRRSGVALSWSGTGIQLRLPATTVDASEYPAILDPLISPETDTGAPVLGVNATVSQTANAAPAIAYDGTNFLVAWADDRATRRDTTVFAARVSPAGAVLDPYGISLATATSDTPVMAFDGTNYLVAWVDLRGSHQQIYGTRVSPQGAVLDPADILIGPSTATGSGGELPAAPSIAFNGKDYLVAWSVIGGVAAARVGTDGTVKDTQPIAVSPTNAGAPHVASDGANWLIAWSDRRKVSASGVDVYTARVGGDGTVLDATGVLVAAPSGDQHPTRVAFDGTNYLAVWTDDQDSTTRAIRAARISKAGVVLDSPGILVASGQPPNGSLGGAGGRVVFNGAYYVVMVDTEAGAKGDSVTVRLTPAGTLLDPLPVLFAKDTSATGLAYGGSLGSAGFGFMTASVRLQNGQFAVIGARATANLVNQDPAGFAISTNANAEYTPSLAFDGKQHLVAWVDTRDGNYRVYAQRVGPEGTPIDPTAFPVSPGSRTPLLLLRPRASVATVFDGTDFIVAWTEPTLFTAQVPISVARVDATGHLLDALPIAIAQVDTSVAGLALATDGTNDLVAWQDSVGIRAVRFTKAGVLLDAEPVTISPETFGAFVLTFVNGNYLFAWVDMKTAAGRAMAALRVSPAGTPLDASPITVATSSLSKSDPYIAPSADATAALLVWNDHLLTPDNGVRAAHIAASGMSTDAPEGVVALAGGVQTPLGVVDFGGGAALLSYTKFGDPQIYVTRLAADGHALDADGLLLASNGTDPVFAGQKGVGLRLVRPGCVLSALDRFDRSSPYSTVRVRMRTVEGDAGACATPTAVGAPDAGGDAGMLPPKMDTDAGMVPVVPAPAPVSSDASCGCVGAGMRPRIDPTALLLACAAVLGTLRRRQRRA